MYKKILLKKGIPEYLEEHKFYKKKIQAKVIKFKKIYLY